MADCGASAEDKLVAHLDRLLRELETTEHLSSWSRSYYNDVNTTVRLLSRRNTELALSSMEDVLGLADETVFFLPSLKNIAEASMAVRSARAADDLCGQWNTYEYFVTATRDQIEACLAADADPMEKDEHGDTPLHNATSANGAPEVVELLLDVDADPNWKGALGNTALHNAIAYSSYPAVVKMLIDKGADLGARNVLDATPVDHIANNDSLEVVATLAALLPDVRALDRPLLALTLSGRNLDVLDALYRANPRARYRLGLTALHVAAREANRPEVVRTLLAAGADAHAEDERGFTPVQVIEADTPAAREIMEMLRR